MMNLWKAYKDMKAKEKEAREYHQMVYRKQQELEGEIVNLLEQLRNAILCQLNENFGAPLKEPAILEGYTPPDERKLWTAKGFVLDVVVNLTDRMVTFDSEEAARCTDNGFVMPGLLTEYLKFAREKKVTLVVLNSKQEVIDEYPC